MDFFIIILFLTEIILRITGYGIKLFVFNIFNLFDLILMGANIAALII